jgi:hypothetical protein
MEHAEVEGEESENGEIEENPGPQTELHSSSDGAAQMKKRDPTMINRGGLAFARSARLIRRKLSQRVDDGSAR